MLPVPLHFGLWSVVGAVPLKGDSPGLQVEMNPPPSSSPLPLFPSHLLYSHFPVPLSVFYLHLPFQAPPLTPLPVSCFIQMVASSRFNLAALSLGFLRSMSILLNLFSVF